jgi:hypothetical protein
VTGTGHIPREHWPEPEWPRVTLMHSGRNVRVTATRVSVRPTLRNRLAARFWDAMQGLAMLVHWAGVLGRRAWARWRDPRPFGRGR